MDTQTIITRRLRYERRSTGKRVEPTVRDLAWFQAIHRHGPLPSGFLLEFSRDTHRNDTRSLERMGDLYHEANTPHGGPYLDRPPAQWTALSKFERTVYDLTPFGMQALMDRGLIEDCGPAPRALFRHRLMVACVTASIELAIRSNPTLRFIPEQEILARSPNRTTAIPCRVSYTSPRSGAAQTLEAALIPDAMFGIEYTVDGGRRYRFFMLEADRGHEPVRRVALNETSYFRKVLQYQEVVGKGLYRAHFGMTAPMLVLNVTTNATHMRNLMRVALETGKTTAPYMLFRTASEFGDMLRVPDPNHAFLTEAWERAGLPSLRIDQSGEEAAGQRS